MDYIIVVWNEILWKILDKGRNLGTSLIIENHTGMKNASCSGQGWSARQQEAAALPAATGWEPRGMSTSHGTQGQAGQPRVSPFLWVPMSFSRGTPTLHGPRSQLPLAVRALGRGSGRALCSGSWAAAGTEGGHRHLGCEGPCKCLQIILEDRGAFV